MLKSINKITAAELILVLDYSPSGAKKRIRNIRESLGKAENQTLNVIEFCNYEGITVQTFDELHKRKLTKAT